MTSRFIFEAGSHEECGFAQVLKGKDTCLDREIAVKV